MNLKKKSITCINSIWIRGIKLASNVFLILIHPLSEYLFIIGLYQEPIKLPLCTWLLFKLDSDGKRQVRVGSGNQIILLCIALCISYHRKETRRILYCKSIPRFNWLIVFYLQYLLLRASSFEGHAFAFWYTLKEHYRS